tara:strand:- start:294 stop:797 length:504 start_codon:yes stop_codon:yes gene_type:complete
MIITIKKVINNADIPRYATEGSAGFDLKAMRVIALYSGTKKIDLAEKMNKTISEGKITLRPNERALFGTGLSFEIPEGFQMEIRDKSGISLKKGLKVFNAPGTIDSDYRGEVGVILYNSTPYLATVNLGEYIAQGVITPYFKVDFVEAVQTTVTERGSGGYGSTGLK